MASAAGSGSGVGEVPLELTVHSGDVERDSPLVVASLDAAAVQRLAQAGPIGGQSEGGACLLRAEDGQVVVAQLDAQRGELAFVVPGPLAAGSGKRFTLVQGSTREDVARTAAHPVSVIQKLDRVLFQMGDETFAQYTVLGHRRPYLWPVIGPSGASLVRGQGTGDHPHHTGMNLTFGGHSEGGTTNIWSDWDEWPYGPGGRMLHRGWRRVSGGPVYGEVVEDLTYVNTYGDPIVDEVRTIRAWWASPQRRYLDFTFHVLSARDRGPQPFLFALRLQEFMGIPEVGRITNSAEYPVPAPKDVERTFRAAWIDASGPTGEGPLGPPSAAPEVLVDQPGYEPPPKGPGSGPWNGIALLDHPENDGFPNVMGKYAGGRGLVQMTQAHYPPASAPQGPFTFRQRVYVHDADHEAAGVAAKQADYGAPCRVDVG